MKSKRLPRLNRAIVGPKAIAALIDKLSSEDARKTSTFMLVGAGGARSRSLAENLQLPLAGKLRDQLLKSHYGNLPSETCLKRFEQETEIRDPSPDQVWQYLIRRPEKLRNYTDRLQLEFDPQKPIPATYHMIARWFFSKGVKISGIATTNFDYQFTKAFDNVATWLNLEKGKNYVVAELPQDFRYLSLSGRAPNQVIQRLHGALERPWTIVAGEKDNIYQITHLVEKHALEAHSNPFLLLRHILDALDPSTLKSDRLHFYPYQYLEHSIKQSSTILIVGYSFQDKELTDAVERSVASGKEVYLINPFPIDRKAAAFLKDAIHVKAYAEDFLEDYVRALQPARQLIKLPTRERNVLRNGPAHISGYPKERVLPSSPEGEPNQLIDPLYGSFQFSLTASKNLFKVIDTGEVQRLRQIRQLSFVHLKYHGATHDRFTHSLGVSHLADKLMQFWREHGAPAAPRRIESGDHLAFVICSLIHDIGHGPFGHTMDLVRLKLKERGGHEEDTERIFSQIFNDNAFGDLDMSLDSVDVAPERIKQLLNSYLGRISPKARNYDPLHLILDNPGCDIDRLDFVLRDTAASIVTKKGADPILEDHFNRLLENHEKILQNLRIISVKGVQLLAYDERIVELLNSFAILYLRLYRDVYYCWQNISAQAMLTEAVTDVIRSRKVELADIKPLTDVELLAFLEDFENPRVAELAYLVKYRRIFGVVSALDVAPEQARLFWNGSDKEVVEKIAKIKYSPNMLVARLPSKKVSVNLASLEVESKSKRTSLFDYKIRKDVLLGINPPILQVFHPDT